VLAPAAAGSVLEFGDAVHRFCCFILRNVCSCFCLCFSSGGYSLCMAVVSALVPMAQMKPNNSRPTAVTIFLLSLPLAASLAYRLCSRCCAFHARNLFSLFRYALLSFAQPSPDGRRTMITPCCFDDDPSQVSVARLRNAPAPGSLATGVLAGNNATETHQLPSTFKVRNLT